MLFYKCGQATRLKRLQYINSSIPDQAIKPEQYKIAKSINIENKLDIIYKHHIKPQSSEIYIIDTLLSYSLKKSAFPSTPDQAIA